MANIIDIKIPKAIATALRLPQNDPRRQQIRVLKKLLRKARFTEFGQQYRFDDILLSKHSVESFQELERFFNSNFKISHKEGVNNLVTEADHASEAAIINIIKKNFPEHQA